MRHTDFVTVVPLTGIWTQDLPRMLSSATTCAGTQNSLSWFAYNRKCKFQCKFFLNLSSRCRHSSSSVNRSPVRSDPLRSGDVGSVSSVGMAWRSRVDAVQLVHFGQSSAVDSVRAVSVGSNPIASGSVCLGIVIQPNCWSTPTFKSMSKSMPKHMTSSRSKSSSSPGPSLCSSSSPGSRSSRSPSGSALSCKS